MSPWAPGLYSSTSRILLSGSSRLFWCGSVDGWLLGNLADLNWHDFRINSSFWLVENSPDLTWSTVVCLSFRLHHYPAKFWANHVARAHSLSIIVHSDLMTHQAFSPNWAMINTERRKLGQDGKLPSDAGALFSALPRILRARLNWVVSYTSIFRQEFARKHV